MGDEAAFAQRVFDKLAHNGNSGGYEQLFLKSPKVNKVIMKTLHLPFQRN